MKKFTVYPLGEETKVITIEIPDDGCPFCAAVESKLPPAMAIVCAMLGATTLYIVAHEDGQSARYATVHIDIDAEGWGLRHVETTEEDLRAQFARSLNIAAVVEHARN